MFGMGFGEILLVVIVAVVFLGPEKLPKAMVDIAKFMKKLKSTVTSAKSAMEDEINISELKQEAEVHKKRIQQTSNKIYEDTIGTQGREVGDLFSDLKDSVEKIDNIKEKKIDA